MIDLSKTAYLAIDLQEDVLRPQPLFPQSAQAIVAANDRVSQALKNTAALEVLVRVQQATFGHLYPFAATTRAVPVATPELSLAIASEAATNVIVVNKHNPSAFFGTDLDVQLRRFGIETLLVAGVSTSNGVYATVLDGFQHAYRVLVIEDACADRDGENHAFFFRKMFPRLAHVTTVAEVLQLIKT